MAPGRTHRAASAAHKSLKEPDGEDSWDDSDEEEEQPRPARSAGVKRKAPRAVQIGGDAPAAAPKRRVKLPVDLHDLTLMDIIVTHSSAIDVAVKEWVERYKTNRAAAAAELMTLLVKACGADDELSEEDVEGGEVDSIAQRLTQLVQEEGGQNAFAATHKGRLFATHYCMFWDKVLRGLASAELLFDDFELNDKLTRLVTALNISVVRPFRHAATLTAAQLFSSWIVVSKGLSDSRNLTQAQLDAEEKKKGKAANQAIINGLRRTLERTHQRVEDLRNFRSVIFQGVFSHRFRDVSEEIRAIVIEAIGGWVEALPSEYLNDTHLKYLAWALSDRSPVVRLMAIRALTTLYTNSDNVPRLHDFTARFTPRFCELMHDVSEDVAAAGLRLLALLVEHGILKHKDVSGVYLLLAMPSPEMRSAAAELVVNLLEGQGREVMSATAERLKAAAAAAQKANAPTAAATKGSKGGRGSKQSKAAAAQQAAAGGGGAGAGGSSAHAAAAAADAMLEDSGRLKLAGLIAVMCKMATADPLDGSSSMSLGELRSHAQLSAANTSNNSQPAGAGAASSSSSSSALPTLQQQQVVRLVDALWEHMHAELSDIRGMTAALSDEWAVELWGKMGAAHLASLIASAAHMHIFGGGAAAGRGRKGGGRFGRGKAAAAAAAAAADGGAAAAVADEDAQQEVTVLMMQQLPALLTTYQAEPMVVAPLLSLPRLLRLDLYLLRGAAETYRSLLTQVDGLMQRHTQEQLVVEAVGALVYASKAGPEALQEIGRQVLSTASTTAAQKLCAAAAAVGKLPAAQLAEGVSDLAAGALEDVPDALLSLQSGGRRVFVLLAAGSTSLAKDTTLSKACQTLLTQHLAGRELGPSIASTLLHICNTCVLWRLALTTTAAAAGGTSDTAAAAVAGGTSDAAAITAYLQQRNAFVRVLDALLESGASELIMTPEQLLSVSGTAAAGGTSSQGQYNKTAVLPVLTPELAAQLSVGLESLQDLAFLQLTDLVFLENATGSAAHEGVDAAAAGGGRGGGGGRRSAAAAAAAAAGGFGRLALSSSLERLWRYCVGVLEREGPPSVGEGLGGEGEEDVIEDADEEEDDDFDDIDAQGVAARRAARAVARRDALAAAAAGLDGLKHMVLNALCRLLKFGALPEPGFSWLLSRVITLLDGYGPQAASATRDLLAQLKSGSRDGGLVTHLVEGLTLLYDNALDTHGIEDAAAAAGGGHRGGDRHDPSSWAHVAAVSSKLAGLFQGHNLSQLVLGSLMDKGLAWALEEPLNRAPFPLVCLGPFLSKVSPSEAERLAAALGATLEGADLGGGVEGEEEEEEAAEQLQSFLAHLKERAAGKKVTRGVLKTATTPNRAAAAAAAHGDDEDADEDQGADAAGGGGRGSNRAAAGKAAAAAGGKGGGNKGSKPRKGSRIRFAADVDEGVGDEHEDGQQQDQAPAAARGRGGAGRGKGGGSSSSKRGGGAGAAAAAVRDGGWVTKHRTGGGSSSSNPKQQQQQQQARRQPARGRQQQQQAVGSAGGDEDMEDAVEEEEEEQQQQPKQRQQRSRGTRGAAAPAAPPAAVLHSQSESLGGGGGRRRRVQQQLQQQHDDDHNDTDSAAAGSAGVGSEEGYDGAGGDSEGGGAGGVSSSLGGGGGGGSLLAHSDGGFGGDAYGGDEEDSDGDVGGGEGEGDGSAPAFFSAEQLPALGRRGGNRGAAAAAAAPQQQQQEEQSEQEEGSDDLAAAGGGFSGGAGAGGAGGSLQANSEEDGDEGWGGAGGHLMSTASLPSLQVVIDDVPEEGDEVDEPPPTRRYGRRR